MERVVRVLDTKAARGGGGFFLDLHEVLPAFVPDGHAWRWAIRCEPEVSALPRWDLNLPFIYEQIDRSRRGFVLTFEELQQFASRINQVVWGEFIAAEYEGDLPARAASPSEVGRHALAGALAFDSSFWFLGGPAALIERATDLFELTEAVAPEDWPALD